MPEIERDSPADPREREDWFLRLPPEVQARTRAVWQQRRAQVTIVRSRDLRVVGRGAGESALLMAVVCLFVDAFVLRSLGHVLGALLVGSLGGAIVGAVIVVRGAGRFDAALAGTAGYLAVQLTVVGFRFDMLALICFFFGGWLTANVYGVYGLRWEARRSVFETGE